MDDNNKDDGQPPTSNQGHISKSTPAVNADMEPEVAEDSLFAEEGIQRLAQLRNSEIEDLKNILSGTRLDVTPLSSKSLVGVKPDSEQRDTLDGIGSTSLSNPNSKEQLANKSELKSISEDAGSEESYLNTPNAVAFDALLNLVPATHTSQTVLDIIPEYSLSSSSLPLNDKSYQVDFTTLVLNEITLHSLRTDRSIAVLKLAIDIAVSECLRCHCGYGNLELDGTETYYSNPMHRDNYDPMNLYSNIDSSDFCVQANMVQPVLPSQDIYDSMHVRDNCVQCELVSPDELEDQASEEFLRASSRGSRKSVTILEAEAWLKNSTDIAVTCHLPIRCKSRGGTSQGGITLNNLLHKVIDNVISNKTSISPVTDVTEELTMHAKYKLINSLNCLSYKNVAVNDPTLVNWLISVGYLATLEQLLMYYLEEAMITTSSKSLFMQTETSSILSSNTSTTTASYSLIFAYTLEDIAVQDESSIRSSHVYQDMNTEQLTGMTSQSPAGTDSRRTTAPGIPSVLSSAGSDRTKKKSFSSTKAKANWGRVKEVALIRKKSRSELIRLKRMSFLDDLLNELSPEELSLVHAVFLAINKSHSAFITTSELRNLLIEAFGQNFTESTVKKIMSEVDVDKDGYLCLLDLFGLFYLTEIYLQALGDGFRDNILTETSKHYTASHALLFIAISELCFYNGFRLSMDTNIFIRQCEKSNVIRCKGDFNGLSWEDLDTRACRLFCFSLLGLDNGVLVSFCYGINDISKLKLSPFWSDDTRARPRYTKDLKSYTFADIVMKAFQKYKEKKGRFFCLLTDLAKPTIPNIGYRPIRSSVEFEPPYVYSYQGKETFMRPLSTGSGFESRCTSAANHFSLSVIQSLEKRGVTLVKLFLEPALFHSRKLHNIVKTFCYNGLAMWPRPAPVPKCSNFFKKQTKADFIMCSLTEAKLLSRERFVTNAYSTVQQDRQMSPSTFIPSPAYTMNSGYDSHRTEILSASSLVRSSVNSLMGRFKLSDELMLSWGQIKTAKAVREELFDTYKHSLRSNSVCKSIDWWNLTKSSFDVEPPNLPPLHYSYLTYLPQRRHEIVLPPLPTHKGSRPYRRFSREERQKKLPPFKNFAPTQV